MTHYDNFGGQLILRSHHQTQDSITRVKESMTEHKSDDNTD